VIDVARLISDPRTIDHVVLIESKVIIQLDMLSQWPAGKPQAGDLSTLTVDKHDTLTLSCPLSLTSVHRHTLS
jgi:hypothetical protein